MDMDPITRREAFKIEEVLEDLVRDLEVVSFLPESFDFWLRDDTMANVEKADGFLFPEYLEGEYSTGESEERERLLKARAFIRAATHFGDPADSEGNEAVIQVAEFSEVEKSMYELASTVGTVGSEDLEFHHLSLRALIDTLQEGGYVDEVYSYLQRYFPPPTPSSSSTEDDVSDGESSEGEKDVMPFHVEEACEAGLVNESIEHMQSMVHLLHRIIQLRNTSTVNEDVHRYKVLHEAVNKEQSATADVQALNREYEEVKASRRKEVAALDDEIRRLQEELQYVQRAADVELDAFHEVSAKIQSDHRQAYQEQLEVHRQAADAVKEKMRVAQMQHTEVTNQLRSLRAKKEAAVSGAVQEYESQMAAMTGVIERLQKEYHEDTSKVTELEEKLEQLHKEKKEYEVEQQVNAKQEEHQSVMMQGMDYDAKVLQAYFRAYMARVKFEREMAKSKKKGKKGKKGKKKK